MVSFIFGALFGGMTLLAIGLQRTYNHFPLKELKRQARAGHPVAQLLYRPVSYGISLRVLLWLVIVVSATLSFVLLSRSVEPWFAIVIVGILVWLGLFWIPSSDLTTFSIRLARLFTPAINWLLNYLDKPLHRAGEFVRRHRHINFHTGLYEKEDIADLLENQRNLPDNRIPAAEIDLLQHALNFGDKQVQDVLVPLRAVRSVNINDNIGPSLMDELYKSGHSRFPVYENEPNNIVGTLYMRDMVHRKSGGTVKDAMKKDVFYVHEDFTLWQALQAFLKTKKHLFIVVNSFEEFIGIITVEDILEQIIGKSIVDEFDAYEDMRAVASAAAKKDHLERQKQTVEPAQSE